MNIEWTEIKDMSIYARSRGLQALVWEYLEDGVMIYSITCPKDVAYETDSIDDMISWINMMGKQ